MATKEPLKKILVCSTKIGCYYKSDDKLKGDPLEADCIEFTVLPRRHPERYENAI